MNPNIPKVQRVISAVFEHGAYADIAAEIAHALDAEGLLVAPPVQAPVLSARPSPAAMAKRAECKRAAAVAEQAPADFAAEDMPPIEEVSAQFGEVRLVVAPQNLNDWARWTRFLDVNVRDIKNVSHASIASGRHGGVRVRLIGRGVPALQGRALRAPKAGAR